MLKNHKLLFFLIILFCFIVNPSISWSQEVEKELPTIKFLPEIKPSPIKSSEEKIAIKQLLKREPWHFNYKTIVKFGQDFTHIPQNIKQFWSDFQFQHIPLSTWFLFLLILLALVPSFVIRKWLRKPFKQIRLKIPLKWPPPIRTLAGILLTTLTHAIPYLTTLMAFYLLWSEFDNSLLINILIALFWYLLTFRVLSTLFNEFLINEKDLCFPHMPQKVGTYYYRCIYYILFCSLLFRWVTIILEEMKYEATFIAFLDMVFYAGMMAAITIFILLNKNIFYIFPEFDEPAYQKVIKFFKQSYHYFLFFTIGLGILWLLGYANLAQTLFIHSWAVIGLIFLFLFLHKFVQNVLKKFSSSEHKSPNTGLTPFTSECLKLFLLIEILLFCYALSTLINIYDLLLEFMKIPLIAIGHSQISVWSCLQGILLFVFILKITKILSTFFEEHLSEKLGLDTGTTYMINTGLHYFLITLGALSALTVIGLDLSIFTIFAGALGVGIGFGLQGIAKNFASGVILIFGRLVKKEDFITVDENTGFIEDIGWRKVHLKTIQNVDLIVPTSKLIESTIINWTHSDNKVRVHIPIGVSYNSDVEIVKTALFEAAKEHPAVLKHPPNEVWLTGFGESSIDFELLVWIDLTETNEKRLKGEINFNIWHALARHNIEIPFPQRDIHIRTDTSRENLKSD